MSRLTPLLAVLLLSGCQDAAQTDPDSAPPIQAARSIPDDAPADAVARHHASYVTVGDVDARILATPLEDRPAPGADLDAWYREQIRLIVMDRLLLDRARSSDLEGEPDFVMRRRALERQIGIRQCLAEEFPEALVVDQDEIETRYRERLDDLQAPERRSVVHLYRRIGPDGDVEALDAELNALRDRVMAGERFETLAAAHSASESRHREGSLGWFTRGQLPAAFDDVVFSLDEGVPSRPVHTPDGAHLFLVGDILPERRVALDEAAPQLRAQLLAEQEAAALDELAARNASPTVRIIERDELERLGREDDPDAVVLEASDYTLTLGGFRTRLRRAFGDTLRNTLNLENSLPMELAWTSLERLERHEAAFEVCRSSGHIDAAAIDRQIEPWIEQTLTARMRQAELRQRALEDSAALERFFASNRDQFLPPVEWQLERLQVPFAATAAGDAAMARLEALAAADESSLEEIRRELGGEIEMLEWLTISAMHRLNPKLGQRVAATAPGSLVPPLRIDDQLELYRVADRRQPDAPALEDVKEAVVSAYLRQYTAEIYTELEDDWLAEAGFQLFESRLEQLRRAGRGEADISIEELEDLLSEP